MMPSAGVRRWAGPGAGGQSRSVSSIIPLRYGAPAGPCHISMVGWIQPGRKVIPSVDTSRTGLPFEHVSTSS